MNNIEVHGLDTSTVHTDIWLIENFKNVQGFPGIFV